MPRRLYAFVDESGNHSESDCYVVAACWCLTDYDDDSEILKPTTRRITSTFDLDERGELKGAELSSSVLTDVLSYCGKAIYEDNTIDQYDLPWAGDDPIAYTLYDSDSDIGNTIAERHLGETGTGITPQLVALASVISPILRIGDHVTAPIDSYHVMLDAKTWERPRYILTTIISSFDWMPSVNFVTRNSHNTPGIQLADISAYTRRSRILDGDLIGANSKLNNQRL